MSIVVVTWHSAADVPALLASLAPTLAEGADLVVVENASGDATPALVTARVPGARILVNDRNRGFAAAANQGLAVVERPYVLFLNPDAVAAPDAVPRALAALASDPTIAVVGCRTLNADGTPQPTVDRFHSVSGLVREALTSRRGGRPRGESPTVTSDVEWVYGSFLLCRRTALVAVGGFDEAYEMYGEDLDLCHRLHAAGFRIVYAADAVILHHGNRSGALRYGADRDAAVLRGTLRFFRRRRGRVAEWAFRLVAGTSFAVKGLVYGARALAGGGAAAGARARTYAAMARLCVVGDADRGRLRPPDSPGIEGR